MSHCIITIIPYKSINKTLFIQSFTCICKATFAKLIQYKYGFVLGLLLFEDFKSSLFTMSELTDIHILNLINIPSHIPTYLNNVIY